MRFLLIVLFFSIPLIFSCTKNAVPPALVGEWKWVIQYANNPAYNSTPQSSGIQEVLYFTGSGYSLTRNGTETNSGTYKTATARNASGDLVLSILFSNATVVDSVAYYTFGGSSDSLFFSHDLIGTVGSGSRHYGRQ